jgi:hypothetical protein
MQLALHSALWRYKLPLINPPMVKQESQGGKVGGTFTFISILGKENKLLNLHHVFCLPIKEQVSLTDTGLYDRASLGVALQPHTEYESRDAAIATVQKIALCKKMCD